MNAKQVWAIRYIVLTSLAAPVGAATINYDAVVTFATGPHSANFIAGETIAISYALNPLAVDSFSDPRMGVFDNAVLSLSVVFPNIGVFVLAGPSGRAQTFDNFVSSPSGELSDQVFFFGRPISSASLLGGEQISYLEVDFLSNFVIPPDEPLMLSSDALPLSKLPIIDAFVFLGTSSGSTGVHFAASSTPSAIPEPRTLISLATGLVGLFGYSWRNHKKREALTST